MKMGLLDRHHPADRQHRFDRDGGTWHLYGCTCRLCEPPAPSAAPRSRGDRPDLTTISWLVVGGMLAALPIGWLIDRLAAGPGVLAVFGL